MSLGKPLNFFLPLWLMLFLGHEFLWSALFWQVYCHVLSIFDFMTLVFLQCLDFFYNLTLKCTSPPHCPCPIWRVLWLKWCYLLGSVAETSVHILGSCDSLYTGWLYLTNSVTFEDNWLHQIFLRAS